MSSRHSVYAIMHRDNFIFHHLTSRRDPPILNELPTDDCKPAETFTAL
jgi:hypothetical protein